MSITAKQLQEACATISDQDIADLQATLVGSVDSIIRETLQPAFAQIADSAGKVLAALLTDVATSAKRVVDELQADVERDLEALQQAASVLPVDRPIRASWPLSCQILDCTGEPDKEKLN